MFRSDVDHCSHHDLGTLDRLQGGGIYGSLLNLISLGTLAGLLSTPAGLLSAALFARHSL